MINNKWMENPVLSDISTEKMEVLTKILMCRRYGCKANAYIFY